MAEIAYNDGHVVLTGIPKGIRWFVAPGHHGSFTGLPHEQGESSAASVKVPEGDVTVRMRSKSVDMKNWFNAETTTQELSDNPMTMDFQ